MHREHLAKLSVRIAGGTDGNGAGNGPVAVFLHGYGAPGGDLAPLARELGSPHSLRYVFPEAPILLAQGFVDSRAWWHIDWEAREKQVREAGMLDLSDEVPNGLDTARAQVNDLLEAIHERLGSTPETLILGGFSQGAMLACDVALRAEIPPRALVLMSPTLLCRQEWEPLAKQHAGLPVFMSHGTADPVLPYPMSEQLMRLLTGAGMRVEWVPHPGGHEIPRRVTQPLTAFLGRCTDG